MKSGLEGRNNWGAVVVEEGQEDRVSMKSGLEGRNNPPESSPPSQGPPVSMKSGLEGRNNLAPIRAVMVRPLVSQ